MNHARIKDLGIPVIATLLCASAAVAYEDDYLTSTDDSVRTNWVGDRVVYIFTNTASAATVTFKQAMTYREALVVGGGGGGGSLTGGGGGGGGIMNQIQDKFCASNATISVTVGNGGAGGASGHVGANGSHSICVFGDETITAYGGAGGAGYYDNSGNVVTGTELGSGGGATLSQSALKISGTDYTEGQGHPGGNSVSGAPGGGGGWLEDGHNGVALKAGSGAEGMTNAISGVGQVYGSGGGGGGGNPNAGTSYPNIGGTNAGDGGDGITDGTNAFTTWGYGGGEAAVPGFGGGGGGGGYLRGAPVATKNGGKGGSGTVVLALTVGGEAGQPVVEDDDISITFPDNCTQPSISVVIGGEAQAVYSAAVTISCGTGALAQAGTAYDCVRQFKAVNNGDTVEFLADFYPNAGEIVYVHVLVTAAEANDDTADNSKAAEGVVPAFVGHGGDPARIIHVRDGASGKGDGTSWMDAYPDFRAAISLLDAARNELWYCGTNFVDIRANTISPVSAATLRGGFSGVENSLADRMPGAKSVINGNGYNCFVVANAQPITFEGFLVTNGLSRGIDKTGAGDITITNCVFDANGQTTGTVGGRAIRIAGTAATVAILTNCRITGHRERETNAGGGGAVYLSTLQRAIVDGCTFVSNGAAFGARAYSGIPGRSSARGVALSLVNAPVTMRGCCFRANLSPVLGNSGFVHNGGIVSVEGDSDNSAFTNCLFVGNELLYGSSNSGYQDSGLGSIVMNMASPEQTLDVVNCTLAHNLYWGYESAAGLGAISGTANILNCLFAGNRAESSGGADPKADIKVMTNATVNVRYTLFDQEDQFVVDPGGTFGRTNCIYADPLFVTTTNDISGCYSTYDGCLYYNLAGQGLIAGFNVHLRGNLGYTDETSGETVAFPRVQSPAIDAGDWASVYMNEPFPNGHRVNLGFYGNTPYATMSPLTGSLMILR